MKPAGRRRGDAATRFVVRIRVHPSGGGVIDWSVPAADAQRRRLRLSVQVTRNAKRRALGNDRLRAMAIYNERMPTTDGLRSRARGRTLTPQGRDVLLEAYFLTCCVAAGSRTDVNAAVNREPATTTMPASRPPGSRGWVVRVVAPCPLLRGEHFDERLRHDPCGCSMPRLRSGVLARDRATRRSTPVNGESFARGRNAGRNHVHAGWTVAMLF